ncbi:MAG: DUF5522 domain-containing protein [Bdellovibrionota bacterium]
MDDKKKDATILPLVPGDYYLDPEGLMVFTEAYHIRRGYCCESGCKHCPYGFDKKKAGDK